MLGTDKGQQITLNNLNVKEDELPMVGGVSQSNNSFVSGGDLWMTDDSW